MYTRYEEGMFRDISRIAKSLEGIEVAVRKPAHDEAIIELRFRVHDAEALRAAAQRAITESGGQVPVPATLGAMAAEALLHSNPAVASYLDYGIELITDNSR